MKNSELDRLLKSASVPERPTEYWEHFPQQVTTEAHRRNRTTDSRSCSDGEETWVPWWLKDPRARPAVAIALLGVLMGIGVLIGSKGTGRSSAGDSQLAEAQQCFREIQGLFPNQLQAIVFDEGNTELLLADTPNVPVSAALYLRISGPNGCRRVVTFSGQRIRVNGDLCDVLMDHEGNVLLVGPQFVWSSGNTDNKTGGYQIEARVLRTTS